MKSHLIRRHRHAGHGHGAHVHLCQGPVAAIHMHHAVCWSPLVGKLLLGEGAVNRAANKTSLLLGHSITDKHTATIIAPKDVFKLE